MTEREGALFPLGPVRDDTGLVFEYSEMVWNFDNEQFVFMGFEVWQTANEIRSISVLTMDLDCVKQAQSSDGPEDDSGSDEGAAAQTAENVAGEEGETDDVEEGETGSSESEGDTGVDAGSEGDAGVVDEGTEEEGSNDNG